MPILPSLSAGQRVRHKSEGRAMVILRLLDNKAYCEWFSNDTPKQGWFDLIALEAVDDRVPEPASYIDD